jgi:hypothetical protein
VAMDIASPYWTVLWGIGSRCLSPVFPWSVGVSGTVRISDVIPPGSWFVSSDWSLLPTGQVVIELFDCLFYSSLPDSPRWSNMFLLSPGSSCVVPLLLRLWEFSPSPYKLNIVPCIHSYELFSVFHPVSSRQRWLILFYGGQCCWGWGAMYPPVELG